MRGLGVLAAACALTACGAEDPAVTTVDAATVLEDVPARDVPADARDAAAPDVRDAAAPDAPVDVGLDAADAAPDAPPDVPRDVAPDLPRDAPMDAPRDVAPDLPRDVAPDADAVPLPSAVPAGAACHELLQRLGVRFTVAGATRGIVDPVTVTTPINGVGFHNSGSYSNPDRPLLMDCRLAVALWHLTGALRSRWNVTDLAHLGVYNYRVIAGTTTLSQHAYATAIDISNLRTASGTTHSVATNFTMNGQPTCPPRATDARDRLLKEVACWMYDSRVFNIILTPNYNADHRDHFHVDLTPGAHTIRFELPGGVDPPHDPFLDSLIDDE